MNMLPIFHLCSFSFLKFFKILRKLKVFKILKIQKIRKSLVSKLNNDVMKS